SKIGEALSVQGEVAQSKRRKHQLRDRLLDRRRWLRRCRHCDERERRAPDPSRGERGTKGRPSSVPERRQSDREKRKCGGHMSRTEDPPALPIEVRRIQQQIERADGSGDDHRETFGTSVASGFSRTCCYQRKTDRGQRHER